MHTTSLILNVALALATVGALAAAVRVAFRMPSTRRSETLHPSQPLPLLLVAQANETRDLARAA